MQKDIQKASRLALAIIRVRLGLASEEEREFLVAWLDENELNRQTYKRIVRGVPLREQLRAEERVNQHTDYAALHRRVLRQLLARRRRLWRAWTSAAAAACIAGMVWAFWPDGRPEPESAAPVVAEAVRSDAKVKLILSSGEEIGLDAADSTSIDLGNAVAQNGQLVYDRGSAPQAETQWNKVVTEVGGEYNLVLADGTQVWLNAASELEYPVRFAGSERRVRLRGEAYFDVSHDARHPFIVETGGLHTRVLGTEFNIQAYGDEAAVHTALVSGRVQVAVDGADSAVELTPGREAVWTRGSTTLATRAVDVANVTAWRHGSFVFDAQDLAVVTRMLSRWYGVDFVYADGAGRHTFSGRLDKADSLADALERITLAGGPDFRREGDVVYVVEPKD